MSEKLAYKETPTNAADNAASERRKHFWNKVIGWGVAIGLAAEFVATMLTPFKPLLTPIEIAAIAKAATFFKIAGIGGAAAGGVGRVAAAFSK
jgi:uncharacterized membrane protein required for colicin V production